MASPYRNVSKTTKFNSLPDLKSTPVEHNSGTRRRATSDRRYRTLISKLSDLVDDCNVRRLCDHFSVPRFARDIIIESEDIGAGLFMYVEGQHIISSDDVSYLEENFMKAKEYSAVRLIREYDNEVHGRPNMQGTNPTLATELPSLDPYNFLLYNLSKYVNRENTMKLLPTIGITQKEQSDMLDSINPGLEIFKYLDEKKKISRKDVSYLRQTFKDLHNETALNSLEKYQKETGQEYDYPETTNHAPEIQPFTFLLYNLSQCVSKKVINQIIAEKHIELWITKSKWDSIMLSSNPTIEFIKHLEKRRRITTRDISLLKALLKDVIVAVVFLNQYETEIQMSKANDGAAIMSPAGIDTDVEISQYSFLLYNLSRCIPPAAVEKLLENEILPGEIRMKILQSRNPSVELVKYLEKVQKVSRGNVSYLELSLRSSGLYIAAQYVVQYQVEMARGKSYMAHQKNNPIDNGLAGRILTDLQKRIGIDKLLKNGPLSLDEISEATATTSALLEINIENLTAIFFHRILSNDLRAFSVFRTFFKRYETEHDVQWLPGFGAVNQSNVIGPPRNSGISCRDALYTIFLSCDFNVRLMLILQMAACQFALPILLPFPGGGQPAMTTFMELYHLNFTWYEKRRLREGSVVRYPFPTVAAVKFGENELSKSSVINMMLGKVQSSMGHDFFLVPKEDNFQSIYSQGTLEAVWYLPIADSYHSDTSLKKAMCVMNLRGCCNGEHLSSQRDFVFKFATVVIAFIDNQNFPTFSSTLEDLSKRTNVIVVVTFSSSERYVSAPTVIKRETLQILVCRGCSELRIAEEVCKLLQQLLQSENSSRRKTLAEEGVNICRSLNFETIT